MRYPSIKTLSAIFDDPKTARGILDGSIDPELVSKAARDYVAQCYHAPPDYLVKLYALDELGDFFGVEYTEHPTQGFYYLNAGDTYAPTLVRRGANRYQVTTIGDVIETIERRGRRFQ